MNEELVTLEDIAGLYRTSYRQARDVIVKTPGFPSVAPGASPRKPRWVTAEVRAFLRRKPERIPKNA
jgi:hypothetical protein